MLSSVLSVLVAVHGLGAALGAGGSLFAEIFYAKATADGHIDRREREWFRTTFFALRSGLTLVLFSTLGIIYAQYFLPDSPQSVFQPAIWMELTLALFIVGFASALMRKRASWGVAASAIFAGWWMLFLLDLAFLSSLPYLALLLLYVLMTILSSVFWGYVKTLAHGQALRRIKRLAHAHQHSFPHHGRHA